MTRQEIGEVAGQIAHRRLASPEFAMLAAVKAECDEIGTRITNLTVRRRQGRPASVRELVGLVKELYRHQKKAHRVFRQAMHRVWA